MGFPLEFCIGAGSQKTRMMGLSDGGKSFRIGLAVLIQYRSVTDTQPATQPPSHVDVAITLNAKASSLKTANIMFKTYRFKTHYKGDSHCSKTANIILPGLMIEQR